MQELNYTKLLDFLNKRKITYILWDKIFKIWICGDKKGELGRDSKLDRLFPKVLPIFEDKNNLYLSTGHLYEEVYYEFVGKSEPGDNLNEIGEKLYQDMGLFNILEQKFFNYIWVDEITKNWIIGDFETKVPVSYSNNIRNCIRNLVK